MSKVFPSASAALADVVKDGQMIAVGDLAYAVSQRP